MSEDRTQTRFAATAGAVIALRTLEAIEEKRRYPGKYSTENIARFDALKEIYKKYHPSEPNSWGLDPVDKTPLEDFTTGTWEQHWSEKLLGKEFGALRVDVENVLSIISNFLDKRRLSIWTISSIQKGDIEEKFFAEILNWTIRCLDCSANDSLSEVITNKMKYIKKVMDSPEIFPKNFLQDKSISFSVCRDIYDMLEELKEKVTNIHNRKFVLEKFQHISDTGELLIFHFMKGFSFFSQDVRKLKKLDAKSVSSVVKKSDSRYANMFLSFLEHAFLDRTQFLQAITEEDLASMNGSFNPKTLKEIMFDKSKAFGISVPMPEEIQALIPEVFINAYHLSVSMKLIHYAANTLSEQGTVNLFCNREGRQYFDFLVSDFNTELNALYKKLVIFNKAARTYSDDTYQTTRRKRTKHTDLGQYTRFQTIFGNITDDYEKLQTCLFETAKKIEEFAGVSPEDSQKKKRILYKAIRERMRLKNKTALADELERITETQAVKARALPSVEVLTPRPIRESKILPVIPSDSPLSPISPSRPLSVLDEGALQVSFSERKSRSVSPMESKRRLLFLDDETSRMSTSLESETSLSQASFVAELSPSPAPIKEVEEVKAIRTPKKIPVTTKQKVRKKLKEASIKINAYCTAFMGKTFFRSKVSADFGNDFQLMLQDAGQMPFHVFFKLLSDFIKVVKIEDEIRPGRKYLKEDYYTVAVDLYITFSETEYMRLMYEEPVELDELRMEVEAQKEAHTNEQKKSHVLSRELSVTKQKTVLLEKELCEKNECLEKMKDEVTIIVAEQVRQSLAVFKKEMFASMSPSSSALSASY